jgi:hypothetical protein
VQFEIGRTPEGDLEAMFVSHAQLLPPDDAGIKIKHHQAGASPAVAECRPATAGTNLEAR